MQTARRMKDKRVEVRFRHSQARSRAPAASGGAAAIERFSEQCVDERRGGGAAQDQQRAQDQKRTSSGMSQKFSIAFEQLDELGHQSGLPGFVRLLKGLLLVVAHMTKSSLESGPSGGFVGVFARSGSEATKAHAAKLPKHGCQPTDHTKPVAGKHFACLLKWSFSDLPAPMNTAWFSVMLPASCF